MSKTRTASRPLVGRREDLRWTLTVAVGSRVGARRAIEPGESVELGRNGEALGDGALVDPRLSRQHVRIDVDPANRATLRDLDSRNGTFVNGTRVQAHLLDSPQVISLGSTALVVDRQPVAFSREVDPRLRDAIVGGCSVFHGCLLSLADAFSRAGPSLLVGPAGVGKTFVATTAVHQLRPAHRLVSVPCRNLDPGALERIAQEHRPETTVLLESVDELGAAHHAALERLMANADIYTHLLATSCTPVSEFLAQTHLAPAVAHRLCRWPIVLPLLRGRLADLGALARAFVTRHLGSPRSLDPGLILRLLSCDWPGNLHQLEALIERCVAAVDDETDDPIGLAPGAGALLDALSGETNDPRPLATRVLRVHERGDWFRWDDGPEVAVRSGSPAARTLAVLAREAVHAPGTTVSVDLLLTRVWPEQALVGRSGRNRLYVALTSLRKAGLAEAIERCGCAYRVPRTVAVTIVGGDER